MTRNRWRRPATTTPRLAAVRAVLLAGVLLLPACADATLEPPPGCIVNAENAAILAEAWLTEREFLWGDPEDYSFDGQRWRLTYDTPAGEEPTRAVIVDCRTGAVTPG